MRGDPTKQLLLALVAVPLLGMPLIAALDRRTSAPLIAAGGGALVLGLLALRSHRHERRAARRAVEAAEGQALPPRRRHLLAGTLTAAIALTLMGVVLLGLAVLRG